MECQWLSEESYQGGYGFDDIAPTRLEICAGTKSNLCIAAMDVMSSVMDCIWSSGLQSGLVVPGDGCHFEHSEKSVRGQWDKISPFGRNDKEVWSK